MRRTNLVTALIIALPVGLPPMAALGSEAVKCVQAELLALGHDPGPVDGAYGSKTASAFATLSDLAGEDSPIGGHDALNADNAADWCERLASLSPEAADAYEGYEAAVAREAKTGGLTLDVADDVPEARLEEILEGLAIARSFIDRMLGGEIPAKVRAGITVKVVATGRGNEAPSGGGSGATAFAEGHPVARPFFDVAHQEWSQNTQGRGWTTRTDNMKTVVHEYTHAWQASLGAISLYKQDLGNWMNEGIAEYVGYRAMEDAGLLKWSDVQAFMARSSRGPEADEPLEAFGTTQSPAWAGHIGFLAIDWLVSEGPGGIEALRTIATEVAAGKSQKRAFSAAFGLELADFYAQFDVWREIIRTDPERAAAARPKLVLAN